MNGYMNDAAKRANERLYAERQAYNSTTAPLMDINNTLKSIKSLLQELVDILKAQNGKSE